MNKPNNSLLKPTMHLVKGYTRLIFSQYRHAGNCASLTDDLFEDIPFNLDPDHK